MGKNGELLRKLKAEKKTYTFTSAQLQEHDEFVIRQKRDEIKRKLVAEMDEKYKAKEAELQEAIRKEWADRESKFKGDDWSDNFFLMMSLLLSVSCRVLIEKFHWKPIPKDKYWNKTNRLARFGDAIIDEINGICNDEMKDIRWYVDETYELYGVKFMQTEDDDSDGK